MTEEQGLEGELSTPEHCRASRQTARSGGTVTTGGAAVNYGTLAVFMAELVPKAQMKAAVRLTLFVQILSIIIYFMM